MSSERIAEGPRRVRGRDEEPPERSMVSKAPPAPDRSARATRAWGRLLHTSWAWIDATDRSTALLRYHGRVPPVRQPLQEPLPNQMRCVHPPSRVRSGGNQYARWTKCSACGLRLSYFPAPIARKSTTRDPRVEDAQEVPRDGINSQKEPQARDDSEMGVARGQAVVLAITPMLNSMSQRQAEMFQRVVATQREESRYLRQLMTTLASGASPPHQDDLTEQYHLPELDPMATEFP